jgi:hypothetical protein
MIREGATTWRDLPLPFMATDKTGSGHDGAQLVAQLVRIEREGADLIGWTRNIESDDPDVLRLQKLMADGVLKGVSVDMDQIEGNLIFEAVDEAEMEPDENGEVVLPMIDPKQEVTAGRLMGATAVPFPAFAEAQQVTASIETGHGQFDTLQAAADAPTGLVLVAVPEDGAKIAVEGGLPASELHATIGYYGAAAEADDDTLAALRQFVDDHDRPFTARVGGVARMGNDDPQAVALLVEAPELEAARKAVAEVAPPNTDTHPHFTPHVTLGYGIDLPDGPPVDELAFAGLELWVAGERYRPAGRDEAEAVAASVRPPDAPPHAWMVNPKLTGPTPITVTDEGRLYGHAALFDTCHRGFRDRCVPPPRSPNGDYPHFHTGTLVCAGGERVKVGNITVDSGHADLSAGAALAKEHYDNTGWVGADVVVGEDEFGIWVAGAVRPDLDNLSIRKLMACDVSGDWRSIDGRLRLIGLASVPVPGFVKTGYADGLVASMVAAVPICEPAADPTARLIADRIAASIGRTREHRLAERDALAFRVGRHPSQLRAELAARVRGGL